MPAKPDTTGLDLSRPLQPRWVAPKRLRPLGFKPSVALKLPGGNTYMTPGQAMDAVISINAMIAQFEAGLSVAGHDWAHIAPKQAQLAQPVASARSIGHWLDAYLDSRKFQGLSPATQRDTRSRLKTLIQVLAGEIDGDPKHFDMDNRAKIAACARYTANIDAVRAMDIMQMLADDCPLQTVYDTLREHLNPRTGRPCTHQANAVNTYASSWLSWVARQKLNGKCVIPFNPATQVERTASPGRVNPWPVAEFDRAAKEAIRIGWLSIEEAMHMARELMWSQQDILALTYGQFVPGVGYDDDGKPYEVVRVYGTRGKTEVTTHTTLTTAGLALFQRIKRRWQTRHGYDDTIEPAPNTPLFVVDAIPGRQDRGAAGKPWASGYFQHKFVEVKQSCNPPVLRYQFQDLRDTAFTEGLDANLAPGESQSRGQWASPESVQRVGSKHYGAVTLEVSDRAARKIDKLREMRGRR